MMASKDADSATQTAELNKQISTLVSHNEEINSQLLALTTDSETIKSTLEAKLAEQLANSELMMASKDVDSEAQAAELNNQISRLVSQNDEINAQMLKLTADSEVVKISLEAKLAEQLANSESMMTSKDVAFGELNSKYDTAVSDSEAQAAELNNQISRLVSQNDEINAQMLKLTADSEVVKISLEAKLVEQLNNSESMMASKDATIGELNSKYDTAVLDSATKTAELNKQISTLISQKAEINSQLLKLTTDSETVKASLESKLSEQLNNSESMMASKDANIGELNSKYDTAVLDSATKTAELNEQISRLVSQNAKINTKILKLTADSEAVKATLETKLAEQLTNSESMLAAKDAIIGTLNSKYISAQTNIKSMQVELEDAASTGIMPQSIVTRDLLTQIDDLNHQSKRTIKKSHSLTKQISILLTRNNKIEDDLLALTKKSIKLRLSMNGKLQDSIKLTNGQETLILNLTSKINSAKQASNKLAKQNKAITSRLLNDNFLIDKKWTNKFTALAHNQKSVIKLINKRDNSISNLNAKLLNSVNTNHDLKKRFNEASTKFNKQISALISTNSSIEKTIKALSTKSKENKKALNLKIKEQNIANQKVLASKEDIIGSLKTKYSATKLIADSADDRIAKISDSLNQQISLLIGINAKIDSEIKSLKSTSAKVSAELETKIKEQNIANQKALASKEDIIGSLKTKYSATKLIADSADDRIAKISDSLNQQISLLIGINAKIDSEIKSLKSTSAKVSAELETKIKEQNIANQKALASKEDIIGSLKTKYSATKLIADSADDRIAKISDSLNQQISLLIGINAKIDSEIKSLKSTSAKVNLDLEEKLAQQISTNKIIISGKDTSIKALEDEMAQSAKTYKSELSGLVASGNLTTVTLGEKSLELKKTTQKLNKLILDYKSEKEGILTDNKNLINKLARLNARFSASTGVNASLKMNLDNITTSLNKQISILISKNVEIENQFKDLSTKSDEVKATLELKLTEQNINNQKVIAAKDSKFTSLEKVYSSTKSMADSANDKLAKKTTSLNKQISLLLSVNATIDSEINNLKKTSAKVNSALESKLATQILNNNDIISSKDGLIHDLKSKIIGFDKEHKLELSKLIAENSLSQKSFQDINDNLKSLKDKLKSLIVIHSSEKKSLLSKNANLAKKVDSLKDMAYKEATLTDISAVSKNKIIESHMEQLNNLKQIVNQLKSPAEIKKYTTPLNRQISILLQKNNEFEQELMASNEKSKAQITAITKAASISDQSHNTRHKSDKNELNSYLSEIKYLKFKLISYKDTLRDINIRHKLDRIKDFKGIANTTQLPQKNITAVSSLMRKLSESDLDYLSPSIRNSILKSKPNLIITKGHSRDGNFVHDVQISHLNTKISKLENMLNDNINDAKSGAKSPSVLRSSEIASRRYLNEIDLLINKLNQFSKESVAAEMALNKKINTLTKSKDSIELNLNKEVHKNSLLSTEILNSKNVFRKNVNALLNKSDFKSAKFLIDSTKVQMKLTYNEISNYAIFFKYLDGIKMGNPYSQHIKSIPDAYLQELLINFGIDNLNERKLLRDFADVIAISILAPDTKNRLLFELHLKNQSFTLALLSLEKIKNLSSADKVNQQIMIKNLRTVEDFLFDMTH